MPECGRGSSVRVGGEREGWSVGAGSSGKREASENGRSVRCVSEKSVGVGVVCEEECARVGVWQG